MAAVQVVISTSPGAAGYFQAPRSLLDNRIRLLVVGGTAALFPALFGLYALSGWTVWPMPDRSWPSAGSLQPLRLRQHESTYQESDWRRTASAVSDSRTSSLLISRLKLVWMIPSHAITFAAVNQLTAVRKMAA